MIVKLQSLRRFVSICSGQVAGGYRGGAQLMLGRGRWGMEAARGLILGPGPEQSWHHVPTHLHTWTHTTCSSGKAWCCVFVVDEYIGRTYSNTSIVDSEPQHNNLF